MATGITVAAARSAAHDWVKSAAHAYEGYVGAYFSGSTVEMPPLGELPLGSDVDVVVVTRQPVGGLKLGKFLHHGVLLEVTHLPWDRIAPAGRALADYHLAGGLRTDTVIDDPTGRLRALQRQVAAAFADETWVRRRCENVRQRIENGLRAPDTRAPWHDRVTGWLFPTGVTAHLILVAALRNPTVRLRYLRAREALTDTGLRGHYPLLLRQLGAQALTADRVERHIDALSATFDCAASVSRTPFFFSSDLTAAARPIAVDASYALARRGDHQEVVFWLVATAARCHKVLAADAPDLKPAHEPAFAELLADIGITSGADLRDRAERTLDELPEIRETAEEVMAATAGARHARES
ncbi:hypothetical protein [Streptomyces sp. NRRL F-5123]|uniref:hypothetical protein n=1 Tax=Streptomyces sp. NRRL F-5123 TaxID=1463856 RepID=UPI000AA4218F|nr:hypothetical protein [Streptomyces sp. NRRL F-5123]